MTDSGQSSAAHPSLRREDFTLGPLIGRGRAAQVYQAVHEPTARPVALKIWRISTETLDQEAKRRFGRGCQILSALSRRCDRVVGYVGSGWAGGYPWLAMDLHDTSLAGQLAGGPLPVGQVLSIADDVLVALVEIHAAGQLHRNLAPATVLLTGGRAAVGDFGITLAADSWTQDLATATRGFLAPEVQAGELPSPRSDLYSLGRILQAALPNQLPVGLQPLLRSVTYRDPADRPADAATLRAALAALAPAADPAFPDPPARPTTHVPFPPAPATSHPSPLTAPPATGEPAVIELDTGMPPASPSTAPWLLLAVLGHAKTVAPDTECILGRGPDADVDIPNELVSRRHAALRSTDGGWQLVDLDSTNGLWHEGMRVHQVWIDHKPVTVHLSAPDGVAVVLTPRVPGLQNARSA